MFPLGASEMCVGGWSEVGRELNSAAGVCVCGSESNKWEFPGLMSELETNKIKWKIEWQLHWSGGGEASLSFQITAKIKQN